ncbi:MAG: formate C-acetyltransferase/glycerol dehydratase family glycyl radical enzyme [Promethearchaeota archaeon]|nr:MAG: formate C-acetyltransferase/glycerol dehydratase family glycyl radical enzyme [Candidatus Lokiarchaeota archaeon]
MQIEQTLFSNHKDRILKIKERVINQPHEICIERAKSFTESYKTTRGESPIIRFAKAMEHLLLNMTIKIWDDEFIVGNRTLKLVGTPLYPEVRIDTIEQDYETYDTRLVQRLLLTDEDKSYIKEVLIPYWKYEEETVQARFIKSLDPDLRALMEKVVFLVDTELTNGIGHFLPGHAVLLKYGIKGLIEKAEKRMIDLSENISKLTFLKSVVIVCNAVKKFIQRFSNLAKDKALQEKEPLRQKELYEISQICQNISENPPNSFEEAIQLIYFNQLICGLEDGGYAVSVGRLDQDLYPFYLKDKKEGKISDESAQFLIEMFYLKLNTLWNYVLTKGVVAAEGPPITENLTIGGVDRDGKDATNELSYIMLESYNRLKTFQPTFSVRIHEKTPEDFLYQVGEAIKSGASIALFNDDIMIKSLVKLGFALEDAREYAPIGCVEPQHPYKSFGSTNANQINIVKCLELALTNGVDLVTRVDYGVKNDKKIITYEDIWDAFKNQTKFFIKNMVLTMDVLDRSIAELNPQPFLSAVTENCLENGLDVTQGGAIYNFTGAQLIGLATVADSLAVIKKIVFEDKLLTLEELVQMLKKNYRGSYKGKTGSEWREIFINKVPKYGNDDDYVDQIAVDVVNFYCNETLKHKNYRGGTFNPGILSTAFHLAFGIFTGASADGRKSKDILSNGVSPTNGRDKNGPTAILNSVKKLEHGLVSNGDSLILSFHPNTLRLDLFSPLIRTFFQPDGGFHIQFNVVGKDTLCQAQKHPDEYRGLIVRIAGYSVIFTELSKIAQDEIIARTEY